MLARLPGLENMDGWAWPWPAEVACGAYGIDPTDATSARLAGRPVLSARGVPYAAGMPDDMRLMRRAGSGVVSRSRSNVSRVMLLTPDRFLWLRIVIEDGMSPAATGASPRGELVLEDADGVGPGSLDRAEWTRCSKRCTCPIKPRICRSELDGGKPDRECAVDGGW